MVEADAIYLRHGYRNTTLAESRCSELDFDLTGRTSVCAISWTILNCIYMALEQYGHRDRLVG